MNSKNVLILVFIIIMFILLLLFYKNYKDNEENIIENGFELIVNKNDIQNELKHIADVLNINISNIKNMKLCNIFENEMYWDIEINDNIFIRFDAINKKIIEYHDNNKYTDEIINYMKYNEVQKFIIDKYINLGYNNQYSIDYMKKFENIYLWEAVFISEKKKIVFEFIPEINKIINIYLIKY